MEQELAELIAELDSTARVVSARLGKKNIPWTTRRGASADAREVVFRFPEPLTGPTNVLNVETAMAVVLASHDFSSSMKIDHTRHARHECRACGGRDEL